MNLQEIKVDIGAFDANGTSLKGYLPANTTYRQVVRVFGEPIRLGSPDNKVQAQWTGKINNKIFTIYDYKSSVKFSDNLDWHIGGKEGIIAELVNAYFESKRGA